MADFWDDVETGLYFQEALRYFNCLARYYRTRLNFQTTSGQALYDLTKIAFNPSSTAFTQSVTDSDLVRQIQYHLLEPVSVSGWTGTEMYTMEDLTDALEQSRNAFLLETGSYLYHYQPHISPPPAGRVQLQDNVMAIRRAAFQPVGSTWRLLHRADEQELNSFSPGWALTPGDPSTYSVSLVPPFQLQLAPPPLNSGILDLLVAAALNQFDPTALGTNLGVSDDFSWVVKYGALYRLLASEGPAYDPLRAEYCKMRWQEGIQLARNHTAVLEAQINGVQAAVDSLFDLDVYSPGWQNSSGQPTAVATAANILALSPVPDGIYSIVLDVVQSAPMPSVPGDIINISRGVHDVLSGYAEHIAAFKMGGEEFLTTSPLIDRMIQSARSMNSKLRAESTYSKIMESLSAKYSRQVPERTSVQNA